MKNDLIREAAEADLITFIKLVAPHILYGALHEELISWWSRQEAKDNQLVLLPRGHMKSKLAAYRTAWWITKHPETTVLYVGVGGGMELLQFSYFNRNKGGVIGVDVLP